MANFIINKELAYNIWSTIVDAPIFDSALTLQQLKIYYANNYDGLLIEEDRMSRLERNGCSGFNTTLQDCISINRAGLNETKLSNNEFILKYLTLPNAL